MGQQSDLIEEGLTDTLRMPLWARLAIVVVIWLVAGSYLYVNNFYSPVSVKENLVAVAGDVFLTYVACAFR